MKSEVKFYLSRDFFGGELFPNSRAIELDIPILIPDNSIRNLLRLFVNLRHLPPNEPLHREESILRVHNRLPFRNLAHQPVPVLRIRHHGRRRPLPLGVGHYGGLPTLHGADGRVRRPQVDADDFLVDHAERPGAPRGEVGPEGDEAPERRRLAESLATEERRRLWGSEVGGRGSQGVDLSGAGHF